VTCWILGASLTACSSTPLELPNCDVPAPLAELGELLSVPEMPVALSSTDATATFNLEGIAQLTRLRVVSMANKRVGDLNTAALQARNEEVNQLIECVRYQNIWMDVREDMLEQERQDHAIDNLWHRGVIVLGAIAVAL